MERRLAERGPAAGSRVVEVAQEIGDLWTRLSDSEKKAYVTMGAVE